MNVNMCTPNVKTCALFTRTSMSLNSAGNESTNPFTSPGLLTSNFTGSTWTPEPTSFLISDATSFNVSILRAVRISLRLLGEVRANSNAGYHQRGCLSKAEPALRPVLLPIPDDAPVTTIVLPSRRFAIAVAIVRLAVCEMRGL